MRSVRKVEDNTKALEVLVSDDNIKLFVKAEPKEACVRVREEDLMKELLEVTKQELIDEAVVRDIARELRWGKKCEARRVVKGTPAVQGRDGKIVWLVRRFTPGKNQAEKGQEFKDFFTLGLFENIRAGQEIARVYKPTLGTSGIDAFGKEIFAVPGKAYEPKFNESVKRNLADSDDTFDVLVANVNGYVHDEGGSFAVREVLQLPGNVDYSMGHIDFIGAVKVAGDVQKGFHIKARGPIDIAGSALGDNVLTSEKSITIKGFHNGGEKASVSAGGSYSVSVAQGVSTEVQGHIVVEREARDCSLRTHSAVFCDRGVIVGGTVWCVKGFEGGSLGNEAGAHTVVELRNDVEVTLEYRQLSDNIKKHRAALSALELHAGPYLKNRRRIELLNWDFRRKIEAVVRKYDQVDTSLKALVMQEERLRSSSTGSSEARINVTKVAHAGVSLVAGSIKLEIKEEISGGHSFCVSEDGQSWVVNDLKPLPRE